MMRVLIGLWPFAFVLAVVALAVWVDRIGFTLFMIALILVVGLVIT